MMINVIVLFSKIEEARNIRNLLVRNGFNVCAVCTTGYQAIEEAENLASGIIVCGAQYADMMVNELKEELPDGFEMLLIASAKFLEEGGVEGVVSLSLPLRLGELLATLEMMVDEAGRRKKKARLTPKVRSREDKAILDQAKGVLMERNHMSEEEAHRYIQKRSMDNGTNLIETAQMILALMDN